MVGLKMSELEKNRLYHETINSYRYYPISFLKEYLKIKTWSGMQMIIDSVWNNKRTSVRACHGISKCKEESERIQLSDGTIIKVKDLKNKIFEIDSLHNNERIFAKAHAEDNGYKKIKHITLQNGIELKITDNHPLYVAKKTGKRNRYKLKRKEYIKEIGFTNNIKKNDLIAVPIKTNTKSSFDLPDHEIKLLAYVIGDGCTRHKHVSVTNIDKAIIKELYDIAYKYKTGIKKTKQTYRFANNNCGGKRNNILEVIRKHNLDEKLSYNKRVPDDIFKLNNKQLSLFLSRLYACDGNIVYRKNKKRVTTQIIYTSTSKGLIDDIYILLKRIGIRRPTIKKQKTSWKIFINNNEDCKMFCMRVGIIGEKSKRQNKILKSKINGRNTWRYNNCIKGFYWETVKDVEYKYAKTIAISVPETNVFITPYAYEHNTFTAAAIAVAFLNLYRNSIVITTAPSYRQVNDLLWKEIGAFYTKCDLLSGELSHLHVKVKPEWYMLGFSTDKPHKAEGYHSPHILWILDEAKGLNQWLYDALEGSMTGGTARVLEISTTDGADQQCPFRRHHNTERRNWNCIHFSAFDSPFVNPLEFKEYEHYFNKELYNYGKPKDRPEWDLKLTEKIQIATSGWIKEQEKDWKKTREDLWETKVLGEFSTTTDNNVIPLDWIMSAVNANITVVEESEYGLDVARFGDDTNVLVHRKGGSVQFIKEWGKINTMETVGKVILERTDNGIIKVDMIGVGAGVFDRLAEQGQPVIGVDSAKKAWKDDTYFNLRAEMWFTLRNYFEKQYREGNTISIPDDAELISDLSGMKYTIHSDGRMKIEKKDDFKKRYGRSPNKGDALVYAFAKLDYWEY